MEELSVLTDKKSKYETKALYEEVFPEDKGRFSDWYYEDRCSDNMIICMKKDGEVVAMAHLNPFTVCRKNGKTAKLYYIYAVSTKKEERHKGYMTAVLKKGVEVMKEKGIPFCFLIPVKESVYTALGFYAVSKFTPKRIMDYTKVISDYDIFLKEDENYRRRARMEDALCENMEEALPKNPIIMAKIISGENFASFSGLAKDASESEMIDWLKGQRIYISESV